MFWLNLFYIPMSAVFYPLNLYNLTIKFPLILLLQAINLLKLIFLIIKLILFCSARGMGLQLISLPGHELILNETLLSKFLFYFLIHILLLFPYLWLSFLHSKPLKVFYIFSFVSSGHPSYLAAPFDPFFLTPTVFPLLKLLLVL